MGSEEGPNFTIDSGTHTYTFACPIPINCPSSYEGAFGHIRYMVKVTFIRSGVSNRTYTKGFTVLKLLDLNRESELLRVMKEILNNYIEIIIIFLTPYRPPLAMNLLRIFASLIPKLYI